MNATSTFETARASRYLTALVHHFGRRVEAACDGDTGWVQFPFGRCEMTAAENRLELSATAQDGKGLRQVEHIVTSHLERFAFRENPELVWTSPDANPA